MNLLVIETIKTGIRLKCYITDSTIFVVSGDNKLLIGHFLSVI